MKMNKEELIVALAEVKKGLADSIAINEGLSAEQNDLEVSLELANREVETLKGVHEAHEAECVERIAKHKKELKAAEDSTKYNREESGKLKEELEQVHCIIDATGKVSRNIKYEETYGGCGSTKLTAPSRIAALLYTLPAGVIENVNTNN